MPDQLSDELARIKKLHTELCGLGTTGLEKALEIGELLTEIKGRFTHGNWTIWVESKLPFDMRQCQRYMKVYAKRKLLKGIPELNFSNALSAVKSKTTKKSLLRSATQEDTSNSQKGEKSELTPEQQAEEDIKNASTAEQNGAPEKAVDAHGVPITKEAMPYWNRRHEVQAMLTAISRVRCQLNDYDEADDALFAPVANQAKPSLDAAYAAVTNAMPYAVCTRCNGRPDGCTFCHGTGLISKYKYEIQADRETKEIRLKAYATRAS